MPDKTFRLRNVDLKKCYSSFYQDMNLTILLKDGHSKAYYVDNDNSSAMYKSTVYTRV